MTRKTAARPTTTATSATAPSTLRRDLGQQASRFALLTAIGLAAAGAGSLAAPGEALADCVNNGISVVCTGTTTTTDTAGTPTSRIHSNNSASPVSGSVEAGAIIDGFGLEIANTGSGGLSLVNDGAIRVSVGNSPNNSAAVHLSADGGRLSYSGAGSLANDGVGGALLAVQNGVGNLDLSISNDVSTASGDAVTALNVSGTGGVSIAVTGDIDARGGSGVSAFMVNNSTGDVSIDVARVSSSNLGITTYNGGSGATRISASGPVDALVVGISVQAAGNNVEVDVGDVTGGRGIAIGGISGTGATEDLTLNAGSITGLTGQGLTAVSDGGATITIARNVSGASDGLDLRGGNADGGGSGDLNVTVGGDVTGDIGRGARIVNSGSGSIGVDIAGNVSGGTSGLTIEGNDEGGAINARVGGSVNAGNGSGVAIRSSSLTGGITAMVGGDIRADSAGLDGTLDEATAIGDIDLTVQGDIDADSGLTATNAGSGDIRLRAGGDINASSGPGISAIGNGAISIMATGDIVADGAGVSAITSSAVGDVNLIVDGDVSVGPGDRGVSGVIDEATSIGNISIRTNGNVAAGDGVVARNAGRGTVEIDARGPVTAVTGYGLDAAGRSRTTVSFDGPVTGRLGGIYARGGADVDGDVTVQGGGAVTARSGNAVRIENQGQGKSIINVSGPMDATGGHGVVATDTVVGGDMEISVGRVTARGNGNAGVAALSQSNVADVTVISNGAVSSESGVGVQASLASATAQGDIGVTTNASVQGAVGVQAFNNGAGATKIDLRGDVTGTAGVGVFAAGVDIDVTSSGRITGATDGVKITGGGAGGVTYRGTGGITAQNGSGFDYTNPGAGPVDFRETGTIDATNGDGVRIRDTAVGGDIIVELGQVTARGVNAGDAAPADGIDIDSNSSVANIDVTVQGDISADGNGLRAALDGEAATGHISVTTQGSVTGANGVSLKNAGSGAINLIARGDVTATSGDGIYADGQGDISVRADGVVSGSETGLNIEGGSPGGGGDISVTGSGGFVGGASSALLIDNFGRGSILVDVTGASRSTSGDGFVVRDLGDESGDILIGTGAITAADGSGVNVRSGSNRAELQIVTRGDVLAGVRGVYANLSNSTSERAILVQALGAVHADIGIEAIHQGRGAVLIEAEGAVTGRQAEGIRAVGRSAVVVGANGVVTGATHGATVVGGRAGEAGDILIAGAGGFVGQAGNGLQIQNNGAGGVIVDIQGATSGTENGIVVRDSGDSGDIDVTTGGVTAGRTGISLATNAANASLTAVSNGAVQAGTGSGIAASIINAASARDISVTSRTSVSGAHGITITNTGIGAIAVMADGSVSGAAGFGMEVEGRGAINIEAGGPVSGASAGALITGGRTGVAADISVTGAGGFVGRTGIGLEIQNNGMGAVTVDISGASSGATNGIIVRDLGAGGDVSVATGAVSAGLNGINLYTRSGVASLSAIANGDVTATGGAGIGATIENAASDRAILIAARGSVSGFTGLAASHTGTGAITVAAEGPVTATGDVGLFAQGRGAVDVTANGAVSGGAHGALIVGGRAGVASDVSVRGTGGFTGTAGSGLTVFNQGDGLTTVDISGPSAAATDGVTVTANQQGAGDVTVTTGPVTAGRHGVYVESESVSNDVRVTTNGAIAAGANNIGVVARLDSASATGEIFVRSNGSITGGRGIVAQHLGSGNISIEANGRIDASSGSGITATGAGGISVAVGSLVSGVNGLTIAGGHAVTGGDLVVTGLGGFSGTDGNAVQIVNIGSGAVRYDVAGPVTATNGNGIAIVDTVTGGSIDVITGAVSTASANGSAIAVDSNSLRGSIDITAYGALSGGLGGIQAVLGAASALGDITINTVSTVDGRFGISASNLGTGAISIGASDRVTSTFGAAISARGNAIDINAAGPVVGADGGVIASSGLNGAGPLSITTTAVSGGVGMAIHAVNAGAGAVTVAASGPVTGAGGIAVGGAATTGDIRISAASVTATDDDLSAIEAFSASTTGDISIAANGTLTATGLAVRTVLNSTGATGDIDVALSGPVTAAAGVAALNDGSGRTTITATGPVNASVGNGLTAVNRIGDIAITAGDVSGGSQTGNAIVAERNGAVAGAGDIAITAANLDAGRGVLARNTGGDTRVTTTGNVFGRAFEGVAVVHANGAGDITVDARNVSGRTVGISVANNGAGDTDVAVRGLVTGSDAAIVIQSSSDQAARLTNTGDIRNSGNRSSDLAIQLSGGAVSMTNTGNVLGRLVLLGDTNTVDNRGRWNSTGGLSNFAGANDGLTNGVGGEIIGGGESSIREATVWQGLETFENRGLLTLRDGGVGDVISTSANTVLATGSTLRADIGGQNLADLFSTTGTLHIQAGTTLDINFNHPLALGRYIVAEAAQGLTGEFVFEDRLLSAFLGLQDGYTSTTAYVELSQMRAFEEAGDTPNRRETGRGVDSLESGNPLFDAIVVMPDDGAARDAFDRLSGEIHPAMRRAMVDDSRLPRDAVLQRLETEAGNGRYWAESYYGRGRVSADGNATRAGRESTGMLFGMDGAAAPGVTVGVAAGWLDTDIDLDARNSTGTATNVHGMAYAGYRLDRWSLRGGVAYAWTSVDTERSVAFAGLTDKLTSGYDGSVMQAFLETGYRVPTNGGYVEPFLNLTTIHANTDAFFEIGGAARLEGEGVRDDLYMSTLGFRVQTERPGVFSARGMLGLRHMSGDLAQAGQHRFPGGGVFTVLTSSHSDIAAVATFEADWQLTPWLAFGAAFDGAKGEDSGDHTVSGRFRIAF